MATNDENRWYFTKEELENSPSRREGMDADKELSQRQQAANFIQDMGQRLQVTQLCINTAIVYMHRFYCYHSFTDFHRNAIAAAAIFLAAKVEEQPRKLEHIIRVTQMLLQRNQPQLERKSEAYQEQAQELVVNENILLMTLGFNVAIEHPHAFIVNFCHLINAGKDLSQTSYFMASNSLHLTTMCLLYKPTVVACFCIHLVCKWSNYQIPKSNENKPWYTYIDASVTEELLEQLTTEFLIIFEKCPSRLKKKIQNSNCQNPLGNYSFDIDSRNSRHHLPNGNLSNSSSSAGPSSGASHHHGYHQQHRQQPPSQHVSAHSHAQKQAENSGQQPQPHHSTSSKSGPNNDLRKSSSGSGTHLSSSNIRHHQSSSSSSKPNSSTLLSLPSPLNNVAKNGVAERNQAAIPPSSSFKLPHTSNPAMLTQSASSSARVSTALHSSFSNLSDHANEPSKVMSSSAAAASRNSGSSSTSNSVFTTKDNVSGLLAGSRLDQSEKKFTEGSNEENGPASASSSATSSLLNTHHQGGSSFNSILSNAGFANGGHHSRSNINNTSGAPSSSNVNNAAASVFIKKTENQPNQGVSSVRSSGNLPYVSSSQTDIISNVVKEVALAKQNERQKCGGDARPAVSRNANDSSRSEKAACAYTKAHSIFSPPPVTAIKTSPIGESRKPGSGEPNRIISVMNSNLDDLGLLEKKSSKYGAGLSAASHPEKSNNLNVFPCATLDSSRAPDVDIRPSSISASSGYPKNLATVDPLIGGSPKSIVAISSAANASCPQEEIDSIPSALESIVQSQKKKKKREKEKKKDKEKHHHHRHHQHKEKKKHKDDKSCRDKKDKEREVHRPPEPLKITIPKEKLQFDLPTKLPHPPQFSSSSASLITSDSINHQSVKLKIKLPKNRTSSSGLFIGNCSDSISNPTSNDLNTSDRGPDVHRSHKEKHKSRKRHRESDHEAVAKKHTHYSNEPRNGS